MKHKFLKRLVTFSLSLCIIGLLLQPSLAVSAKPTRTTTTTTMPKGTYAAKPIFSSSFVQYWYAQDWSQARWTDELKMLQDAGINEIILQDVADTKDLYAAYFTELEGYTRNEVDMIANALAAADELGMHVRIGLGFNGDWWNYNASNLTWLNQEAQRNILIFNEILSKYGTHPSLSGWYIPYEFSQLSATNAGTRANLNTFLKTMSNEINVKDTRDIMISPFYNSNYSYLASLSGWTTMLQKVLNGTGIDIVALQDSVGAGYNTLAQVDGLFKSTKVATDTLNMKLYADTETFTSLSKGNVPADQNRITSQIAYEEPYVTGFVAFSIDHFQNKNVTSQVANYNAYYDYYLKYK